MVSKVGWSDLKGTHMAAQIVSFHCVLTNKVGKVLSSTFNNDVITQSEGHGDLLKGLVDGLQNLTKGEKRQISLSADRAYGFWDPRLVMECPRSRLHGGQALQAGNEVFTEGQDGERKVFRVTQTGLHSVTLDGNHPLAGQDLVFDIVTTDARDATHEEIAESNFGTPSAYLH
jgi:FKBP-type peptidyl-prolyl cis-trans isomerase SlyD